MQNGHVESFHGKLCEECLRVSWFRNLFDARLKIAGWRKEYNEVRPHSSLDYRTPNEFAQAIKKSELWKRRRLRLLGKRLRRFPLCHSSGDGINSYSQACGIWGQVT
jgi:hypothetical protein